MSVPASVWVWLAISAFGALWLWEHCWLTWTAFRLGERRWPLVGLVPGYGIYLAWSWGLRFAVTRYLFWSAMYLTLRFFT